MTPAQEALNAATMIMPTAALLLQQSTMPDPSKIYQVLLLGTVAHFPIAFSYHMAVALGIFPDWLDNWLRRWDQAAQHVLCIAFSWALSRGSTAFTAFNLAVNSHFIVQVYRKNDGRRWMPVAFCTFLYLLPMLWPRRDHGNYAQAILSMTIGGLAFVPEINMKVFKGWGHSCVFHVALFFYARALGRSTL